MKGHVSKRKCRDGTISWRLRIPNGTDANGKRLFHNRTINGGTRADANKALADFSEEIERGLIGATVEADGGRTLTGESLIAEFMPAWAALRAQRSANGKPLARRSVEHDVWATKHIVAALGNIRVNKLTKLQVQNALIVWEKTMPASAGKIRSRLSTAFADACEWNLVSVNPVVKVSRTRHTDDEERTQEVVTDVAGLRRLRENAVGTRLECYTAVMCGTGCRPAEPLALRPADVDFEGGFVSIARTVVRVPPVRKGAPWTAEVKDEPKNSWSRRKIDVPKYVVAAIQAHMEREGLEPKRDSDRLLFAHRVGTRRRDGSVRVSDEPWLPDSLGSLHERIAKNAGLEGLTLRGIRKSHGGVLIATGWAPQDVARRLGHSKAETTWNYYIKPTILKPRAMADALDELDTAKPPKTKRKAA